MQVVISKKAAKQFEHLPQPEQRKIKKKLIQLANNPVAGKKLSGELVMHRSLRVWPYRIIYSINHDLLQIEVSDILHRQGAYK